MPKCQKCDRVFSNTNALSGHMRVHRMRCQLCPVTFKTTAALSRHMEEAHSAGEQDTANLFYNKLMCTGGTSTQRRLYSHYTTFVFKSKRLSRLLSSIEPVKREVKVGALVRTEQMRLSETFQTNDVTCCQLQYFMPLMDDETATREMWPDAYDAWTEMGDNGETISEMFPCPPRSHPYNHSDTRSDRVLSFFHGQQLRHLKLTREYYDLDDENLAEPAVIAEGECVTLFHASMRATPARMTQIRENAQYRENEAYEMEVQENHILTCMDAPPVTPISSPSSSPRPPDSPGGPDLFSTVFKCTVCRKDCAHDGESPPPTKCVFCDYGKCFRVTTEPICNRVPLEARQLAMQTTAKARQTAVDPDVSKHERECAQRCTYALAMLMIGDSILAGNGVPRTVPAKKRQK